MEDNFAKEYSDYDKSFYDAEGNSIQWIDLENWERKRLFYNYLGTDLPYIILTANVDVTPIRVFAKRHHVSFNNCMVYMCMKVIDSIENYRYRFIDGKPFIIDHTRPIVNHIKQGEELFVMGEGPWPCDDILEFCRICHENQEAASPDDMQGRVRHKLDIINFTSIYWVQYTGFIRTIIEDGVDNAPKFSFGKFFKGPLWVGDAGNGTACKELGIGEDERIWMPISNQTHHGLMDGRHVGLFYNRLKEEIDRFDFNK